MNKLQFAGGSAEGQLIYSDALEVRFMTAAIAVGTDQANVPNATISFALSGISAGQTTEFLKEVLEKNTDYFDNPSFSMTSRYTRFDNGFDRFETQTMLETESDFLDALDQAYSGLCLRKGKYDLVFSQPLVRHSRDGIVLVISASAAPEQAIAPSIEDLIESIRMLQYIPVQLSFALSTEHLPRKIYTNGANYYIDHPAFGTVPGGVSYIDLSTWDGRCRVYDESDLKHFEGDDIELIHRPSLKLSFFRGTLKENKTIAGRSTGDISLIVKNESIEVIHAEAKQILEQNPEYEKAEGFKITYSFNHYAASFTDVQHLQSVAQLIYRIENQLIGERFLIPGGEYEAELRRKFLLAGSQQTTFYIRLHSPASRKTTLVDLKAALHQFAFLPLFQAIRIEASGLRTKLYTNTGETWVSTGLPPGKLPSEMEYVALRNYGSESSWTGDDVSFRSISDVQNTGN